MVNAVSVQKTTSNNNNKKSIIDVANAAYSMKTSALASQQRSGTDVSSSLVSRSKQNENDHGCYPDTMTTTGTPSSCVGDERLDAARAMLGISPCSVVDESITSVIMGGRNDSDVKSIRIEEQDAPFTSSMITAANDRSNSASLLSLSRPRSNSAGLDALAFLATQEQEASGSCLLEGRHGGCNQSQIVVPNPVTSSSDDDSDIMPPPPPRTIVVTNINSSSNRNTRMSRRRSVSNPEGMDKWGTKRLRLVLPVSIIEEEIAEANAAIMIARREKSAAAATTTDKSLMLSSSTRNNAKGRTNDNDTSRSRDLEEDDEDENLDHDQLLRRARSRLLEDLSHSSIASGDKGILTLPHSLEKYKEVYNKNGRIGIYTPAERAAIIARFQKKRKSRVWNKKIRYNCRKNLADRRLRIKGRFVKRSSSLHSSSSNNENAANSTTTAIANNKVTTSAATAITDGGEKATSASTKEVSNACTDMKLETAIQCIPEETELTTNNDDDEDDDTEMPDVTDLDAGFCPTDDQPFRRLRRHTIT